MKTGMEGRASALPELAAASPSSKDSPRDVALREQAEAFALQDRRGEFRIIDVRGEGGATIGACLQRITGMHIHFRDQQGCQNSDEVGVDFVRLPHPSFANS